jgi:hypothetical protein
VHQLFKTSGIDGFSKTALFYSLFGGDMVTGKIIFFKDLKELLGGGVLFQMEKDECLELIVKSHF